MPQESENTESTRHTELPPNHPSDETSTFGSGCGGQPPAASTAERISSFPPVVGRRATILILGSMPGRASLQAQQYYAHPRNAFWPIVAELLRFPANLPYPARLDRLQSHGIALWDVLHSCTRRSSLDTDIDDASIVPNSIAELLRDYPGIRRIYFNGTKAEQAYRRHIVPSLPAEQPNPRCVRLPSTSPAHAARSFHQKLAAWRVLLPEV